MFDFLNIFVSRIVAIGDELADLAAVAIFSAFAGFALFALLKFRRSSDIKSFARFGAAFAPLLALAVLGAAAGLAGGMSRTGVVGEIVPAAFTMLGGVAVYMFGMDSDRGTNVALATVVFATALFGGFHSGSIKRNYSEEYRELRSLCLRAMTDGQFTANREAFERFWNAMTVTKEGSAKDLGLPIVAPDSARFQQSSHLCRSLVAQWRLQPEAYKWEPANGVLLNAGIDPDAKSSPQ